MRLGCKLLLAILWLLAFACFAQECGTNGPTIETNGTRVIAGTATFRKLTPQFFGFNIELIEFENSLWNKLDRRVEPTVVQFLQRFPGAVYRYLGSQGNHFDWKAATGPESFRGTQRIVDWWPARPVQFGPVEYLEFVKQVNGTAWYLLNLYGSLQTLQAPQDLANSAAELAGFLDGQRSKGMPRIYRWELGNELDRGSVRWPASRYSITAKTILDSVRRNYEAAEFVGMTQDWAHTGVAELGVNYNAMVAKELAPDTTEFASHLYYDGKPWGPPLPRVMRNFCNNFDSVKAGTPNASMWVTEHARTPLSTPDDPGWKKSLPQTGSLAAAISTADMVITLARTRNVRGAFIHALHGSGPWPILHKRRDGTITPSAVYWAMLLLRETLLEDVLTSSTITTNKGSNGVGYDTNAAVLSDPGRSRFAVWLSNRSQSDTVVEVRIPSLAGRRIAIKLGTLAGKDPADGNFEEPFKVFPTRREAFIEVDATGMFPIAIPAYSVSAANIEMTLQR